nr:MAG TPA: hypothetical protein [Caudoviricetes sp.]
MPNYLDLLDKRVSANMRRIAKLHVYLDPEAISALDEARQRLEAERLRASDESARVKLCGSALDRLRDHVAQLEQEVRESTLVVVIQALSDLQELESATFRQEGENANQAPFLRKRLELAFVRAESVDGDPAPDVTVEHWRQILDITAPGELAFWSQKLNRAGQAPEFPTFAK